MLGGGLVRGDQESIRADRKARACPARCSRRPDGNPSPVHSIVSSPVGQGRDPVMDMSLRAASATCSRVALFADAMLFAMVMTSRPELTP